MSPVFALAALIAVVAALVQRITGLGFALVATAPLVVLYGPLEGVRLVVLLGLVASGGMLLAVLGEVDWRRTGYIVAAGALCSPLAAWVSVVAPGPVLLLIVGGAALLSLLVGRISPLVRFLTGVPGAVVAGGAAGFLHVTSGLSGPPLVAYSSGDRWEHRSFVASAQVVFLALHLLTLAWRGVPATPRRDVVVLAILVAAGTVAGSLLSRRIPLRWARGAMFAIAWVGAVTVLVRGADALMS
jgi:uncharacterized membrane protein YfcA